MLNRKRDKYRLTYRYTASAWNSQLRRAIEITADVNKPRLTRVRINGNTTMNSLIFSWGSSSSIAGTIRNLSLTVSLRFHECAFWFLYPNSRAHDEKSAVTRQIHCQLVRARARVSIAMIDNSLKSRRSRYKVCRYYSTEELSHPSVLFRLNQASKEYYRKLKWVSESGAVSRWAFVRVKQHLFRSVELNKDKVTWRLWLTIQKTLMKHSEVMTFYCFMFCQGTGSFWLQQC